MHWIEGIFIIAVGIFPWLVAAGSLPSNYQQRKRLEQTIPFVKHTAVMQCIAIFIWLLGAAVFANSFFGLGWPI